LIYLRIHYLHIAYTSGLPFILRTQSDTFFFFDSHILRYFDSWSLLHYLLMLPLSLELFLDSRLTSGTRCGI